MTDLNLATAETIIKAALAHARAKKFNPLAVAVLDARGALKAFAAEDKTSLKRAEIAHGKAHGALAMGMGTRTLEKRARERPHFFAALSHVAGGSLVPVAGGVLVKDEAGDVIGAVGISGDTSDNDEAAALAGINAAGLNADPGSD
jgi:uncharacterized protein GlcG (DUF336 family)